MSKEINEGDANGTNEDYFVDDILKDHVREIESEPKNRSKFIGEFMKVNEKSLEPCSSHLKPKQVYNKHDFHNKNHKSQISKDLLKKYDRGEAVAGFGVKTKFFIEKQKRKEEYLAYATEQAVRHELLLTEEQGYIEPDEGEITANYRQEEIAANVDIQSAAKFFKLNLDFGPYSMRYTKNGRHLLLGGRKGHVAAFDWITKKLYCEMNVMEEVAEVTFLHLHTLFACAQKNYVYIYDNQGTELHCVKRMYRVNRMEFLPYHFLLATGNVDGYVSWLDVSVGEFVSNYNTKLGNVRIMRQNPSNGVLCIGGGKGVVSMWSPKVREPLAKLLCHSTPMSALGVDGNGKYLVSAGVDRKVKVWDLRSLGRPLAEYHLHLPANQIDISQKGALAISQGNYCEIYNMFTGERSNRPYLRRNCDSFIHGMRFCPYEDVLGVSTARGFQSLLVPGSGEPNYDAFEDNPFQTRSQRREHEVHSLLEKIPAELISLDPHDITTVYEPTLKEKIDSKRSLFFVKPPQIEFNSKRKMKGKGGCAKASRNKQIVKEQKRKEFMQNLLASKQNIIKSHKTFHEDDGFIPLENVTKRNVLDRLRPKN